MMPSRRGSSRVVAGVVLVGMLLSVVLATVVSFQSSSAPDGLGQVANRTGLADREVESGTADSPVAGYALGGADDDRRSVAAAGLIGVGVTAVLGFGLFAVLSYRRPRSDRP